jgi:hypothetical protein
MPAIAQTNFGYRGMSLPSVGQLWANFFDPRYGLFVYSPILVLGLAAPWMRGGSHRLPRRETLLILSFTWAFVLFCAANRYSALQWNTGVRYLLPIVPGLVVLSMQVLQATSRVFAWAMLATTFLLSWSTAITHARVAFAFTSGLRSGFELPWLARMSELALVEHTLVLSAIILVGVLAAILVFWNGVVLRGER